MEPEKDVQPVSCVLSYLFNKTCKRIAYRYNDGTGITCILHWVG